MSIAKHPTPQRTHTKNVHAVVMSHNTSLAVQPSSICQCKAADVWVLDKEGSSGTYASCTTSRIWIIWGICLLIRTSAALSQHEKQPQCRHNRQRYRRGAVSPATHFSDCGNYINIKFVERFFYGVHHMMSQLSFYRIVSECSAMIGGLYPPISFPFPQMLDTSAHYILSASNGGVPRNPPTYLEKERALLNHSWRVSAVLFLRCFFDRGHA